MISGKDKNTNVTENGTFLNIIHANKSSHGGEYKCRFTNLFGSTEKDIEVVIVSQEDDDVNFNAAIVVIVVIILIVVVLGAILARKMYLEKVYKLYGL